MREVRRLKCVIADRVDSTGGNPAVVEVEQGTGRDGGIIPSGRVQLACVGCGGARKCYPMRRLAPLPDGHTLQCFHPH